MANIEFSKFNPFKPTGNRFQILTGKRFGKLTVISFFGQTRHRKMLWLCRCSCGVFKVVLANSLARGVGISCQSNGDKRFNTKSTEYASYIQAKQRCTNPNDAFYKDYGGRGIEFRFCSFQNFIETVGRKPTPKHSIDRIDVNGHYEKSNVRWATNKEQSRNKRNNRLITAFGQTKCVIDWAESTGIHRTTINSRILLNWCDECIVSLPPKRGIYVTCSHIC